MSAVATLAATGASLAALGWLRATDAKRRRAFGLAPAPAPAPRLAWGLVLLPGVLVPLLSGAAGFVLWLGATSALGWALVALPPSRRPEAWVRLHRLWRAAVARASRVLGTASLDALESRVAALEAEVAALRAERACRCPEPVAAGLAHRR